MKKVNSALGLAILILAVIFSYWFDERVNLFFKNVQFPLIDSALGIIANFGVVIIVTVVIPSLVLYKKNRKSAYLLWLAFAVSFILAFIMKLVVLRQRPVEAFTFPFTDIINYSFPSMHSMVVFSLLPLLVRYIPKQKYFWTAFAFLVGGSRVYFEYHFLSDVVFGAAAGYFIGVYILGLAQKGRLWKR